MPAAEGQRRLVCQPSGYERGPTVTRPIACLTIPIRERDAN